MLQVGNALAGAEIAGLPPMPVGGAATDKAAWVDDCCATFSLFGWGAEPTYKCPCCRDTGFAEVPPPPEASSPRNAYFAPCRCKASADPTEGTRLPSLTPLPTLERLGTDAAQKLAAWVAEARPTQGALITGSGRVRLAHVIATAMALQPRFGRPLYLSAYADVSRRDDPRWSALAERASVASVLVLDELVTTLRPWQLEMVAGLLSDAARASRPVVVGTNVEDWTAAGLDWEPIYERLACVVRCQVTVSQRRDA